MFKDRKDAGEKLARALKKYKGKGALVLAIPKGGVEVGYEVAKYLDAEFSFIISRKLPFPGNPEFGFGAISEDGSTFIISGYEEQLPKELIKDIIRKQELEIKRRISVLRDGKALPEIKDRTMILVDDGIAMGSTMLASIYLCKNKKAKKIIAASPVSGENIEKELAHLVDEVIILEKPAFFSAVAQAYENWHDVSDAEAVSVLRKWETSLKH
jgi:predicted phosphoribosyltransferase